jgi:hypothetical protein
MRALSAPDDPVMGYAQRMLQTLLNFLEIFP